MKDKPLRAFVVAAIRDAARADARPGAVVVQDGRVVAAGDADKLHRRYLRHAEIVERPDLLLLPAFVNAHAHLDLTDLGPQACDVDFPAWLRRVTAARPTTADAIRAAVHRGVALSRAAGVEWIGDVAYHPDAILARIAAAAPGVSYLEAFGLGARQGGRVAQLRERLAALPFESPVPGHGRGVVVGISPHAPYTAGLEVFEAATDLSENRAHRVCTHAAETPEELAFLRDGTGPYVDHARHYGCTDADIAASATGLHPLDHLEPHLTRARWLLAHCNYVDDAHLQLLKRTGTSVVYCPIASDYFGHSGHRYREMLTAGINVCLGTDSILCQPRAEAEPQPMSILAQMRYLYRRDGADPQTLLAMGTVNGMHALEFREHEATLAEGAPAVFAAVPIDPRDTTDPLVQALTGSAPVIPLRDPDFPRADDAPPA